MPSQIFTISCIITMSFSRTPTSAFMSQCPFPIAHGSRARSQLASSPLFKQDESKDEDSSEFGGFNPFQPGSKIPTKSGFGILPPPSSNNQNSTPGGQVSPRQMRMKELTTDLLACISDTDAVEKLLESNEDFLMEQLNNDGVVLDPDSVYDPSMNRAERFARYKEVMEERIGNARAPAAKNVLSALRDFVTRRE
mmetsp:Transcript_6920/g.15203  ORF Transcript_6920/g.15203 Transcript_6920/m.15203 type:complete len:195 (-) Transcript_6920:521-1105(-)